jgi:uncharacterized protein YhfF
MSEFSIDAFWSNYCKTSGTSGPAPASTCFGDSKAMQTSLCALVLRGVKRATASLAKYYGPDGDPFPKPGDLAIVLDGIGIPQAIIEIISVECAAFNTVDAEFAAQEGEGDGSLAYWTSEHRAFFTRQLASENASFSETSEVILERFTRIWP